jgi:alpha-tubulin suppressor-like RCC1 family protein
MQTQLISTFFVVACALPISGVPTPLSAGEIALGGSHSCAVTANRRVKCWGYNGVGQLGDSTITERHAPVFVKNVARARDIAAGAAHTCATVSRDRAKCWGANNYGQLGDGTTTSRTIPVGVRGRAFFAKIAAGLAHTCAINNVDFDTSVAFCWGRGDVGQIGDGHSLDRFKPSEVEGDTFRIVSIAAGFSHSCSVASRRRGGDFIAHCWGANGVGQLGDGTKANANFPQRVRRLRVAFEIAGGANHTCALIPPAGGVKCWGHNGFGQLGDGTNTQRLTPVWVKGLRRGAEAIAVGNYHSCARMGGGGVKCWGANNFGQLGDGTTSSRNVPGFVYRLRRGVTQIALGGSHTCAKVGAGAIKCWGANNNGQLGDGTTSQSSIPVEVEGF